MYSSSSSESDSEFDDYWCYENNYNRNYGSAFTQNPFYPTMGHPLIYYAQVPQPVCMKQCSRERRKENPNCFVRAFRWYTEDHLPNKIQSQQTHYNSPNQFGFAAWLDEKYEQYLEDIHPNLSYVKMKQTAVVEAEKIPDGYCEPCKAKRFRVKSPWRKKRRARSNETAVLLKKSSQSFQYLLQPKENSCHASECHSSTTAGAVHGKKSLVRSQSYSCVSVKDNEPLDVVIPPEGASTNKLCQKNNLCQNNNVCQKNSLSQKNNLREKSNSQTLKPETNMKCHSIQKALTQDFGCQFPEENTTKGSETQYVTTTFKNSSVEIEALKVTFESHSKDRSVCNDATQHEVDCECPVQNVLKQHVHTQCSDDAPSHDCCRCSEETENATPVQKASKMIEPACRGICSKQEIKIPSKLLKFTSTAFQQTSDCNIRLELTDEYPLFLKIVRADKLGCEC